MSVSIKGVIASALLVISISSCTQNKNKRIEADVQKIAGMECISRDFTHKKFLLASQYTKVDDQLLNKKISKQAADSVRNTLDVKKAELVKQSQIVSDSLLHFLRVVWEDRYVDKEAKRKLDSLVELELADKCKRTSP